MVPHLRQRLFLPALCDGKDVAFYGATSFLPSLPTQRENVAGNLNVEGCYNRIVAVIYYIPFKLVAVSKAYASMGMAH